VRQSYSKPKVGRFLRHGVFVAHIKLHYLQISFPFDTWMSKIEIRSLWSPYGIGQTIIFSSCGFFPSSFFLA